MKVAHGAERILACIVLRGEGGTGKYDLCAAEHKMTSI
jgi:hypothetical protein